MEGIVEKAVVQLDARCEEIASQQATVEADIHHTFEHLHQTLDVRMAELINQLEGLTQAKLKNLAAQRNQLETTQALMKENLEVKEFQSDMLEPNTEADLIFTAIADITAAIQNYGRVYVKDSPDPSKCTVTGKGLEVAAVGEKSTALLQTLSFDNQPSKEDLNSIACELVSELTGTKVGGIVERRGMSQYQISYQPTIKGWHQLHIKVEGQHIKGSPFPVAVEILGTPVFTIDDVNARGVAVNQSGEIVVTEWIGHRVSVFSRNGKRLRSFGKQGSGQGQFEHPNGVAIDGKGCILVTDTGNHRIQKFTAEGKFVVAVGTKGSGPLQFSSPLGIAFNASNDKVYVGDVRSHNIQILNSDLSYVGTFGQEGSHKGQFDAPSHFAFDSSGNVYVADADNQRIQVFTAEGKFLRKFSKCREGRPVLIGPQGVAIDSSDRVYISDIGNYCVSVFTSEGQYVTSFGKNCGRGPGEPLSPTGLAVDGNGVVYVCDLYHRLLQF